jgi:uncharacterized protein
MSVMAEYADITIAGEAIRLLADRALFWPRLEALVIADVHLGKAAALRRGGVPVPHGTTVDDLDRIDRLLGKTEAGRLYVLGDLYHHRSGQSERLFDRLREWRRRWSDLEVVVVEGNHDRRSGPTPEDLGFVGSGAGIEVPPFVLRHEPEESPSGYVLAGHLHPGFRLGRGQYARYAESVPAFHFTPRYGVLPAFSLFTGAHPLGRGPADRVFATAEGQVVEV